MKLGIQTIIGFGIIAMLLASCTSSRVAEGYIQKRKYNKGFHITKSVRTATSKKKNESIIKDKTRIKVRKFPISVREISASNDQKMRLESAVELKKVTKLITRQVAKKQLKEDRLEEKEILAEVTAKGGKEQGSEIQKENRPQEDDVEEHKEYHNQLIAILIALVIGVLGLHRLYLGYYGIAIIQFLTLGMFGIWTLIDIIRLLTGKLKPKNKDFDQSF